MWVVCGNSRVRGHELSRSLSRIEVTGREVRVILTLDLLDLQGVSGLGPSRVSYEQLDASIEQVFGLVKQHFHVRAPGEPLTLTLERYELVEDGHVLEMEIREVFASDVSRMDLTSTLHTIAIRPDHHHLATIQFGGRSNQVVLDRGAEKASFDAAGAGLQDTFMSFVLLGIKHIVTGYDHLAFLLCLLIAAPTVRSLIRVVTAFTIGHSVTLALATFNLVVLPSRLVETAIALSIAYIAVENLLSIRPIDRSRVVFLFGLVHGLGFANILREMHLPPSGVAISLFSFNIGVELGQIAFVLLAYPVTLSIASLPFRATVRQAVSVSVMCLSVYWVIQRAFFG